MEVTQVDQFRAPVLGRCFPWKFLRVSASRRNALAAKSKNLIYRPQWPLRGILKNDFWSLEPSADTYRTTDIRLILETQEAIRRTSFRPFEVISKAHTCWFFGAFSTMTPINPESTASFGISTNENYHVRSIHWCHCHRKRRRRKRKRKRKRRCMAAQVTIAIEPRD
jgi:hypothetical protein